MPRVTITDPATGAPVVYDTTTGTFGPVAVFGPNPQNDPNVYITGGIGSDTFGGAGGGRPGDPFSPPSGVSLPDLYGPLTILGAAAGGGGGGFPTDTPPTQLPQAGPPVRPGVPANLPGGRGMIMRPAQPGETPTIIIHQPRLPAYPTRQQELTMTEGIPPEMLLTEDPGVVRPMMPMVIEPAPPGTPQTSKVPLGQGTPPFQQGQVVVEPPGAVVARPGLTGGVGVLQPGGMSASQTTSPEMPQGTLIQYQPPNVEQPYSGTIAPSTATTTPPPRQPMTPSGQIRTPTGLVPYRPLPSPAPLPLVLPVNVVPTNPYAPPPPPPGTVPAPGYTYIQGDSIGYWVNPSGQALQPGVSPPYVTAPGQTVGPPAPLAGYVTGPGGALFQQNPDGTLTLVVGGNVSNVPPGYQGSGGDF